MNWIYIFISSLSFGFVVKKLFRIKNQNFTIHHILGLFSISIFSWIFVVFLPLNILFYSIMFSVTFFGLLTNKKEVKKHFQLLKKDWLPLGKVYKMGFLFIFITSLAMSSTVPSIFDNESYYIQTIKWLNEFGLVKGLGNLHIFFAQTSSWHILQASFTFPFLETGFNDLNGYLLVIFSMFCFQKLQEFRQTKKGYDLYIGTVLISLPFFIFFLNAPSPDLPVFLISQLLFYLFIKNYKAFDSSQFRIILLLAIFLFVIKITTCVLLLLPIILLLKHYKVLKSKLVKPLLVSVLVAILFLVKNVVLTGYLLYPLEILDVVNVDWKVPVELVTLFKTGTYNAAFDYQELAYMSNLQLIITWLTSFKFNGIVNIIFTLLMFTFPFIWYLKSKEKSVFILYCLGVFHFTLAWEFSPQYRFFFFFMLFFFAQICIWFFKKEKIITVFIYLGFLLTLVPFFSELKLSNYTTIKKTNTKTSTFKTQDIFSPNPISSMSLDFNKHTESGFIFNSPKEDSYFWTTGNGDLPTVNNQQIQFIKRNYKLVPNLRGENLKDGFKSIRIE